MTDHRVVSREEWLRERIELLDAEKKFTRERDELNRKRRELPWVRIEQDYRFTSTDGEKSLADLFGDRGQLLVYHFMFGPDWEQGCPSCSFWIDNFDGVQAHLAARDISLVLISRAELSKLQAYRERMGWNVEWVSSHGTTFNADFAVSFTPEQMEGEDNFYNFGKNRFPSSEGPGASAFIKDGDGTVFHTYSTYARGLDMLNGAYHLMDIAPRGRDEDSLDYRQAWIRRHDQYED